MSLRFHSPQVELDHCISRERDERAAAAIATDISAVGAHLGMAGLYADRALLLSKEHDLDYPLEAGNRSAVAVPPAGFPALPRGRRALFG